MSNLSDRARLLCSTMLAGFAATGLAVSPAMAQDVEEVPPAEEETSTTEEIITVTGSRISRSSFNLTQPSTIVSSDYIELRGQTNAADALYEIPGVFAGAQPRIPGNNGASSSGVGQNIVSVFGLGSQRTLTLVDGRRFVSSNAPSGGAGNAGSQVDLNNVPIGLVDRIEVVKVGGAAVYGADAVAGVVNYIMRDDYEGAEFAYDYRSFGDSGYAAESSARALIGGNFSNGRGNIVMALEYNQTDNIVAGQVPQRRDSWTMQTPIPSERVLDGDGNFPAYQVRLYPQPRAGILSFSGLITPGGLAVTNLGIGSWTGGCNPAAGNTAGCTFRHFDPAGSGNLVDFDPGFPTGNAIWSSGGDGLDLIRVNSAQEGYERWNFSVFANYELTPWLNFSADIFANNYTAENPGFQPPYSSGVFGGLSRAIRFDTDHPFLTDSARTEIEGYLGGPGSFFMHRGWTALSDRSVFNENQVNSYTFALDGDFYLGDRDWSWEVAYQTGTTSIFSRRSDLQPHRWFAAMDVGTNPTTGELDCVFNYTPGYDADTRASGFGLTDTSVGIYGAPGDCVPFDPFGTPSPESLDYVSVDITSHTRIEQEIFSGFITGDLFDLPAGPLGVAAGFERREEFANFNPDGGNALGISVLSGTAAVAGGYTTEDIYGEVHAPIISPEMNIPLVQDLELEASYRRIDNSRAGADDVWAVGMNLRPVEDVMFRANVARTVRAPAIGELFLPRVETFSFASDPCDQRFVSGGPDPATRRANCIADGIDPDSFLSTAVNASRGGITGGNPNLSNEVADSLNYGVVITPRWIEGLALSVDFTRIEIEQAIVNFSLTNIMEACYDSTNFPNEFCSRFTRLPDGQLPTREAFTSGFVNAALREFDTVEIALAYNRDVNDVIFAGQLLTNVFGDRDLGNLNVNVRAYNLQTNTTSNTGFDFNDTTGQYNNPKWRGDIRIVHNLGRLTTFLDVDYTGSGLRNINGQPLQYIDTDGSEFHNLPAYATWDIGAAYDITDTVTFRARIENVGDYYPDRRQLNAGIWNWGRVYNVGITARF